MKVNAFITNCCGNLLQEDKVLGLIYKPDIFDNYKDYEVVSPDKSEIHFCLDCYNKYVQRIMDKEKIDRSKNEKEYDNLYKKVAHNFKQFTYMKISPLPKKKHGTKSKKVV